MAGLAAYALTVGGFAAALAAYTVGAVVLVALVFGSALAVAAAQDTALRGLKAHAPAVKRWGGALIVGLGLWFLALAVFADLFAALFPV